MFNVLDLKAGNKFQLTQDFVQGSKTLPKGLVLSLVSFTVNVYGKRMFFKVIRAKSVIAVEYKNVPESAYLNKYYRSGFVSVRLRKKDADRFINEGNFRSFDNDYKQLTSYGG